MIRLYRSKSGGSSSENDRKCAASDDFVIQVIGGAEGDSVCIDMHHGIGGRRVAGPKPWGSGRIKQSWRTTRGDLLDALGIEEYTP